MADKDHDRSGEPSLEMPSLGSLLRRRKQSSERPPAEEPPAGEHPVEDAPAAEARVDQPPAEQHPASAPPPAAEPEAEAVTEPVPPAQDDPTTILDAPDEDHPSERVEQRPLFADETPTQEAAPEHDVDDSAAVTPVPPRRRRRRERATADRRSDGDGFTLPAIPGRVAAALTGALIGLLAVGATYLALQGCEMARGTSSCGGPGLFLLLAILIALIFLGGLLLRLWQVSDPMSTSFLAVGLLAVVALLFLIDVIFSTWMVLVVPVVAIGTFVLSHWVTTAFVEED